MKTLRRPLLAVLAATAVARGASAQPPAVTGMATYRERIALLPGSVLEIALVDISRADAPAERIAETRIEVQGQVPIPFSLPYDPARIRPQARIAVEARLLVSGRPMWRNAAIIPALTQGAGSAVEIPLVRMRAEAPAGLVGPAWVVEDIAGRGVVDRLRTDISFSEEGRAFGSGGCNRFTGGYALDGAALRFDRMASTQMACAPAAMDQERRFHEALEAVRGWRMEGSVLHLTDAAGTTLLRLTRAS